MLVFLFCCVFPNSHQQTMCRFLVFVSNTGMPIIMADLLTRPNRSIIKQSYSSRERAPEAPMSPALNGDGFGVGWYTVKNNVYSCYGYPSKDDDPTPCVFTSVSPAWNNKNLHRLAEKIMSSLFFAHVRAASPGSPTNEANCHPFQHGRYMFMHNGGIAGFTKIKRKLLNYLSDDVFSLISGTTDSEHCFALFLHILFQKCKTAAEISVGTNIVDHPSILSPSSPTIMESLLQELDKNKVPYASPAPGRSPKQPSSPSNKDSISSSSQPNIFSFSSFLTQSFGPEIMRDSLIQTIQLIDLWTKEAVGSAEPSLMNFAVTDGETVLVSRVSTGNHKPATLYFASGTSFSKISGDTYRMIQQDRRQLCHIITSEPVTDDVYDWVEVPRNHLLLVTKNTTLLLYPVPIS